MQLVVVLHAHLPWVKAAEPWTVEERWLHEALWETYLPLLAMVRRLSGDGLRAPLTVSLSPTLIAMWRDAVLRARFGEHLDAVDALADRALTGETRRHYRGLLDDARLLWREWGADLPGAFGQAHRRGHVELLTTAATHALLPALAPFPDAIDVQLGLGRDLFIAATGVTPTAMWLPECAVSPVVDRALARLDVGVTVVAEHASRFARPDPGGLGAGPTPLVTPTGVVAVPRHRAATLRVWSARDGYPGDPVYREFHRDLGHERADVGPFGHGTMTGLKPYRIDGGDYDAGAAEAKARGDADDLLAQLAERGGPVLLAFDAELFGHWWHEGLVFLDHLLRRASACGVRVVTLSQLAGSSAWPVAEPAASTWGRGGDSHTWLGPVTASHWRLVHASWQRARDAWRTDPDAAVRTTRAALLLQASDWPFLIDGGASAGHARRRVAELGAAVVAGAGIDEPFDAALIRRWAEPRR